MLRDIEEFRIDKAARSFEGKCKLALHGSHPPAFSINDLRKFSDGKPNPVDADTPIAYAQSEGSVQLRRRLAEIYSTTDFQLTESNVLITPGSIMANYLVLSTICNKGDHVICQFPNFGQLYTLPKHLGMDVDFWVMHEENDWLPDTSELEKLVKANTKAIILNNPNNPTGATLPEETLQKVRAIAEKHGLVIVADEIFRPLFHTGAPAPPSVVSLGYQKSVSTGSLSKAYSLPGIRVGWIISPDPEVLRQVKLARAYTTLNVSRVDDAIAVFALEPATLAKLMRHNLEICASNIKHLEAFINENSDRCSWVRPTGSCTAFVRIRDSVGNPVDDVEFSRQLVDETGVSMLPGNYSFGEPGFEFPGYFRLGLGQSEETIVKALELVRSFLQRY
ncbi:Tyrosine aminotransferase [Colletotrichum spinosum]|uniref:Tyrosine aminotransferase n=1 Tax=Colletotrichum spinosum TaxID=1347390 RepID=A0A4R8QBT3_9PEZI|nr:Tyrosine aminotransferase [Colletotrichum spinosum]